MQTVCLTFLCSESEFAPDLKGQKNNETLNLNPKTTKMQKLPLFCILVVIILDPKYCGSVHPFLIVLHTLGTKLPAMNLVIPNHEAEQPISSNYGSKDPNPRRPVTYILGSCP